MSNLFKLPESPDDDEKTQNARADDARYRLIASLMSDYVFSVQYGPEREIAGQWISGAFEAITGYTPQEYFDRGGWLSILHPDDREQGRLVLTQLGANQRMVTEVRIIRKDGKVRWVRVYAHPAWDEKEDRLSGAYGAVQDITERKRAEAELQQREAILEVVAEAANTFLKVSEWSAETWRTEVDNLLERLGNTIHASHAYIFENRLDEDGSIRMSVRYEWTAPGFQSDLDNPKYADMPLEVDYLESWNNNILRGLPYVGDSEHLSMSDMDSLRERGIYALLDVPIFIAGKWWGTIGFDEMARFRNWSSAEVDALVVAANMLGAAVKRRQMDSILQDELRQRKTLIEELENNNAELERFTYTVSHDLRSPLVTIRGFLGYLERQAREGNMEGFHSDMERISNATLRMDNLLKDLLELSRVGRLVNNLQDVSFAELVKDAAEIVHGRLASRGITLRIQPDLPLVHVDRSRLIEVLQNLLDNAAKYMGAQKEPVIEVGLDGYDASNHPIFFVRDNGMGIAPEYHERIFRLFDKLDTTTDGTGVGLALVKRIVEFHGGRIRLESEPGKGSTFFFTLASGNTGS